MTRRPDIAPIFVCGDTAAALSFGKSLRSGYVYVIADDAGRVKIGVSAKPQRRLYGLRNATAAHLSLRYSVKVENPYAVEKAAHDALSQFRVRGEWFGMKAETAIAAVKAASGDELSQRTLNDRITFDQMGEGWREAFARIYAACPATAEQIDPSVVGVMRMHRRRP